MISLALCILNLVLWVWFVGYLCAIPLLIRYVMRTQDSIKVGDVVCGFLNCVVWFLCLPELVEELEDAFGFDMEEAFEKLMDYELFKFKQS